MKGKAAVTLVHMCLKPTAEALLKKRVSFFFFRGAQSLKWA
jgi:hypothetical protein